MAEKELTIETELACSSAFFFTLLSSLHSVHYISSAFIHLLSSVIVFFSRHNLYSVDN